MPLAPWIIEEIKRKEKERRRDDRPQPQLPVPDPLPLLPQEEPKNPDEGDRGIIIIDPNKDTQT